MTADVAARVRTMLAEVLGVSADRIGPGFSADTAPEWTSLNHLMLVSQVETEFGVFFSNREIQELTSFDRIVGAVTERASPGA